jgi:hypothetical protein
MKFLIALFLLTSVSFLNAQDSLHKSIEIGIRSKKYTGFYWENGITAEFYSAKITGKIPLRSGFNLTSSSLGTAFNSNAISMTNFDLFLAYYSRENKKLKPTTRLNLGYVLTNLGDYFEKQNYKNNSMVVGLEVGLSYALPYQLRLLATGGMNIFTINNKHNLGSSIYPVFGQISLVYAFKQIYR